MMGDDLFGDCLELLGRVDVPGRTDLADEIDQIREVANAARFRAHRRAHGGPVIATLFGPSGSGKSSVFNALTGGQNSRVSSVERPATRGALCSLPARCDARLQALLFPTLARAEDRAEGVEGAVVFIPADSTLGVILVDCPDFDTRFDVNRQVARRITRWSDVIVFVTAIERYADRSIAREFGEVRPREVPVIAVLNKVREGDDEIVASFAAQLTALDIEPLERLAIPHTSGGLNADAPAIGKIRALVEQTEPVARDDHGELEALLSRDVMPAVRAWRRACEQLFRELASACRIRGELEAGAEVASLESIEESSKFWLRYSPRGVLRGLGDVLSNPGRLFRLTGAPRATDSTALTDAVRSQGWDVLQGIQLRAREAMQRHEAGRMLLADPDFGSVEIGRDVCDEAFSTVAVDLGAFGRERMERYRAEWGDHRRGGLSRARLWAIDKVLRLLALCLTLTVLPPLIWELLRFIGHPSFTNEVTAEFRRASEAFRTAANRLVDRQLDMYRDALEGSGTTGETATALESLVERIGREKAVNGS